VGIAARSRRYWTSGTYTAAGANYERHPRDAVWMKWWSECHESEEFWKRRFPV